LPELVFRLRIQPRAALAVAGASRRSAGVSDRPSGRVAMLVACGLLLAAGAACRQDMHDQPKIKVYREAEFFADRRGTRPIPENTVARGFLNDDDHLFTGKVDGRFTDEFPFQVTREVLQRGHDRFSIYCTPCHGQTGMGNGMVVQRGFRPPPSFHTDRIRQQPVGYWFDVMTNGFGAMPDYRAQVAPEDRWAIAAYIRALQLSQRATTADVPPESLKELNAPPAPTTPPAVGHSGPEAGGSH
jgi:mono/diheme cytochrome c family protein